MMEEDDENFLPAPLEYNYLKRPFLPFFSAPESTFEEQLVSRQYEDWTIRKDRIKNRLTKTQLSKIKDASLSGSEVLPGNEFVFREFRRLSDLYANNPIGSTSLYSSSTLRRLEDWIISGSCFDDCLRCRKIEKNSGNFFSISLKEDGKRSLNPKTTTTFGPTYGISCYKNFVAQRFKAGFVLYNIDKFSIIREYVDNECRLTDVGIRNKKCYASREDGSLFEVDLESGIKTELICIPAENSFNWGQLFVKRNKLIFASRQEISIYDLRTKNSIINPLTNDVIGTIIYGSKKHLYVVNKETVVTFDKRKLNKNLCEFPHNLNFLPCGGSLIRSDSSIDRISIYNVLGDVCHMALHRKMKKLCGFPRNFYPIKDLLNTNHFESDEPQRKLLVPWTGFVNFVFNENLVLMANNALGNLFCSELATNENRDSESRDWLLENPDTEEREWINHWATKIEAERFRKISKAIKIFERPMPPTGIPLKRSFPKVRKKIQREKKKKRGPKPKVLIDGKMQFPGKEIPFEQGVYKCVPNLVPLNFSEFSDEVGIRVNKIFRGESIFPDLPAEVESDSAYRSESLKRRMSHDFEETPKDREVIKLPEDNMMDKFLRDLDDPNATSTQQQQQQQEEEDAPLVAGLSQPSQSQSFYSSQSFIKKSLRKNKRKKHQMGF